MRITDFEIVDHGIEHSQYFQGCGTSFTSYEHVATGIGSNFAEAYEEACEQIAMGTDVNMSADDWSAFDKRVLKDIGRRTLPKRPAVTRRHSDEHYYHVSIRYNVDAAPVPIVEADPDVYISEHDSNGMA